MVRQTVKTGMPIDLIRFAWFHPHHTVDVVVDPGRVTKQPGQPNAGFLMTCKQGLNPFPQLFFVFHCHLVLHDKP